MQLIKYSAHIWNYAHYLSFSSFWEEDQENTGKE